MPVSSAIVLGSPICSEKACPEVAEAIHGIGKTAANVAIQLAEALYLIVAWV